MQEKESRVAICENCQSFVKACHISLYKRFESKYKKEFKKLQEKGFTIKWETPEETKVRDWSFGKSYEDCKNKKCVSLETLLKYLD